tara:strand:- start:1151 stop:2017 length:867 start_codon:yes stop_codon:yes gene_type:complete
MNISTDVNNPINILKKDDNNAEGIVSLNEDTQSGGDSDLESDNTSNNSNNSDNYSDTEESNLSGGSEQININQPNILHTDFKINDKVKYIGSSSVANYELLLGGGTVKNILENNDIVVEFNNNNYTIKSDQLEQVGGNDKVIKLSSNPDIKSYNSSASSVDLNSNKSNYSNQSNKSIKIGGGNNINNIPVTHLEPTSVQPMEPPKLHTTSNTLSMVTTDVPNSNINPFQSAGGLNPLPITTPIVTPITSGEVKQISLPVNSDNNINNNNIENNLFDDSSDSSNSTINI